MVDEQEAARRQHQSRVDKQEVSIRKVENGFIVRAQGTWKVYVRLEDLVADVTSVLRQLPARG